MNPASIHWWDTDVVEKNGHKYAKMSDARYSWIGSLTFRIRLTLGDASTVSSWVKTMTNTNGF